MRWRSWSISSALYKARCRTARKGGFPMEINDPPEGSPSLVARAEELRREVRELRLAVTQLQPRVERAERVSVRTAVAATIIVVLAVVIGFVGYRQVITATEIDYANARID